MPRLALAVALLAASALPTAGGEAPAAAPPLEGIDVSHHSGEVDWPAVAAAGYAFAYVKATEGVDAADPRFDAHWRALGESGLARGAYHFYVTEDDPEAQARFFLATLEAAGWHDADLVPVVDVELVGHGTPPGWAADLERFMAAVEAGVGVRPMVYTAPDFWDAQVGGGYGASPLWVAEYGVAAPRLPTGFDAWHLWQYAPDRDVPGVANGADLSRAHPELGLDALRIGARRGVGESGGGGDGGGDG